MVLWYYGIMFCCVLHYVVHLLKIKYESGTLFVSFIPPMLVLAKLKYQQGGYPVVNYIDYIFTIYHNVS